MQKGIKNEFDFSKHLDGKRYSDLSDDYKELLTALYGPIDVNTIITCWKSKYNEKADIKIRVNGIVKGVSIKMGRNNSVHQEHIDNLSKFLTKIGVDDTVVEMFRNYILGNIDSERVDASTYKMLKPLEVEEIKKAFNDHYIKTNLFIRFIFQGSESEFYGVHAVIYGTPYAFLWATPSELLHYLITYPEDNFYNINIGPLYFQSYNRNLNKTSNKRHVENYIQIKWYSIREDFLFIKERRKNKQLTF